MGAYKIKGEKTYKYTNRIIILVFLLSFIALLTISTVSASSSVIYVNGSHGNDDNDGLSWATAKLTIKNATGTISSGGTVNIANGVYRGSGNTNIILDKSMTIKGQSKSGTIINGSNNAQIFKIEKSTPEYINIIIQDLTIVNGNATNGGAIFNKNGTLTVNNCAFIDNHASYGGAIYNTCNLTVTDSAFTSNMISSSGPIINRGRDIYNTGTMTAHFNQFVEYTYIYYIDDRKLYDSTNHIRAISNNGGTVDAEFNWWGNNKGPVTDGFNVTKWLVLKLNANPSSVTLNTNSKITADLRYDNYGVLHTEGYVPNGIPITFTTNLGTIGSKAYTVNGIAETTLKSATGGTANVSAIVDAQQLFKSVKIIDRTPPKVSSTNPKNGAIGFSRTATIAIRFSENIKTSTYWPKIYVKNLKTGKIVQITKIIRGNMLYIKMSSRRYAYNWYQVYIPKAAVKDYAGNNLASYCTFKFKTGKYPLTYQ